MDGIGGAGVFGGRLMIRLRVSEGERERLFGCLNVLKVYRLRCFKKTEILSGGGGECEFYTYTIRPTCTRRRRIVRKKKRQCFLL